LVYYFDLNQRSTMNKQQKQNKKTKFFLDYNFHKTFPAITSSKNNYLYLTNKHIVFDILSGAIVLYLGYDNKRVIKTIIDQINTSILYFCSSFWNYSLVNELCKELINGTRGQMGRVYLTSSGISPLNNIPYTLLIFLGSEVIEITVKLAR
jgi:adenosylmethionine-8-amino-7-oxononanoate aminotransferase